MAQVVGEFLVAFAAVGYHHPRVVGGSLMAICGVSMLAFRAALWKVMICGLACSVVASLTLTTSELLRCAAFGPLLTAVFSGLVVLVIGLFRLGWVHWFGRIHEKPNVN